MNVVEWLCIQIYKVLSRNVFAMQMMHVGSEELYCINNNNLNFLSVTDNGFYMDTLNIALLINVE